MTKKRILSVLLTIAMVLSVLTFVGCGSKKEAEEPKPTNVQELLDANKKAQKKVKNYSFTGKGSAEIKVSYSGQEMTVPASFDASGEISDDVIHGKGSASVEALGEKQDVDGEIFMDMKNKKVYSKTSDSDSWSSSEMDFKQEDIKVELPDSLKDILEFAEEDDAYVLTADLSKIDLKELIKSIAEQQEDMDNASIEQALAALDSVDIAIDSGTLKMEYDKDTCLIKSFSIKEMAGSGKYEYMEGENMDVSASLDVEFTFSDYDKVSADSFKLPEVE